VHEPLSSLPNHTATVHPSFRPYLHRQHRGQHPNIDCIRPPACQTLVPRPSPQHPPAALPYPILRYMSSTSQSRAVRRRAADRGADALLPPASAGDQGDFAFQSRSLSPLSALLGSCTTIDDEFTAGDKRRLIGGQIQHAIGDICGRASSAEWDTPQPLFP
jgi:hypothetical protein